jgi:hypothetical protein
VLFVKDLELIEAMGLPLVRRPWGGVDEVDPEGNVIAVPNGDSLPFRAR